MLDKIFIHINRKYKVPLLSIKKIVQQKTGRVWVYYTDKNNQQKIAVTKEDGRSLLAKISQYTTIFGLKPFILEKK